MIKGKPIKEIIKPQVNYRAITALNSSMLRLFDSDPVKFYEQFKLGIPRKSKSTISLIIGDIVDFYILDCKGDDQEFENRMEEKFVLMEGTKGTGQVFLLADTLFEITQENLNEREEITLSFETRFTEAFQRLVNMGKYGGKSEEKALKDFNENALSYYEALLKNSNKTVVDLQTIAKSKRVANLLLEDSFTKRMFTEDDETEYFSKFPIEWNYPGGMPCKSEIDILRINHEKKKIYPMDLKTTYDNENFEYSYIKHGYYIQAAFYHYAVMEWARQEGMGEYKVMPMEFIVADTSSNNRRPIRYTMSEEDLMKGLQGFTLRGVEYKGVDALVEEIKWAENNDMWNCSRALFKNDGVIKLNFKYE